MGVSHSTAVVSWIHLGCCCPGSRGGYAGSTLRYTSPELVLCARSDLFTGPLPALPLCGRAVDCWALGATAFEMLTGCCLFKLDQSKQASDMATDECDVWEWRETARLHREWVRASFFLSCIFPVPAMQPLLKNHVCKCVALRRCLNSESQYTVNPS
jgi:hypothetical protein